MKSYKHNYNERDYPVEHYKELLVQYRDAKLDIERVLYADAFGTGLMQVKGRKMRREFMRRIDELDQVLFNCVKKKMQENNKEIETGVDQILGVINAEPRNIEELVEIRTFANSLDKKMVPVMEKIHQVMDKMRLLEEHQYRLKEEEFNRTWISFSRPLDIFKARVNCLKRLNKDEKDFYEDYRNMKAKLSDDFENQKVDFEILQQVDKLDQYEDAVTKSDIFFERIEKLLDTVEIVNRREGLFKLRTTNYMEVTQLKRDFTPFYTLWNLARDYFYKINTWMSGMLGDIDRDQLTTEVNEACSTLLKLEKVDFKEKRMTGYIAADLRKYYELFKPFLPIICDLRNPGLKRRHWEEICELTKIELDGELHISLKELLDEGIEKFKEEINQISDCATREQKLEDAIFKMKDEWKAVKFEVVEYRNSETYVLRGAEPVWELLDEHIAKTMVIASSPYIKFLAGEVNHWKNTLVRVQEILEEWTNVQKGWLYLWPIFSSEDIVMQMPQIAQIFANVDKNWRNIMYATHISPVVLDACTQHKIYENFLACNDMIDKIQKGLNDYLNTKRRAFPRFYFLSNDDLLSILSQTKEPARVQEHLNKCFEGIARIEFAPDLVITGMYSANKEFVHFEEPIDPFTRGEEKTEVRNVEDWLCDVERAMKGALRAQLNRATQDFSPSARPDWITRWPGMIVQLCNELFWTHEVEEALLQKSLPETLKAEEARLQELVNMVKGELSEIDSLTVSALIVLDVHAKDVVAQLCKERVTAVDAFEWICQMRYYSEERRVKNRPKAKGEEPTVTVSTEVLVKMVNTVREYGFEYLGNQPRLVITPLTDRCYRTLMGALHLYLGGAPEGPAGTGKTETSKDLAKATAKQCIVFNCSEQLNVESMAKFFKGLASCGAWACFDEFNRIELEVLSVIATQILTIQSALQRRRPNAPFEFDDELIPLNPTCAVFITMNPGYAGRSELPDNLKALFRPVAMMIPNYNMIAEILLYSYGFNHAREHAIKITLSLRLASEQLSTQSHYDYGMRAVKSIVVAAGELKRLNPLEEETQIVLRAVSDCNIPKFVSPDIPLFEGIVSDLFPGETLRTPEYALFAHIDRALQERGLQKNPEF